MRAENRAFLCLVPKKRAVSKCLRFPSLRNLVRKIALIALQRTDASLRGGVGAGGEAGGGGMGNGVLKGTRREKRCQCHIWYYSAHTHTHTHTESHTHRVTHTRTHTHTHTHTRQKPHKPIAHLITTLARNVLETDVFILENLSAEVITSDEVFNFV
jgi:hypothetical protein